MSRRQSRVSTDIRQTDTLLEFETFKKKFLLANKHITKLNSTLSVRIEELNAQISTLHVENLRLRASEIALLAQLKKEKEKSRRTIADAEAATFNLMKQLGLIRKTYNISSTTPDVTPPQRPPQPRARRPIPDPTASPPMNRIARPPDVPEILEEDELELSSPESPQPVAARNYNPTVSPSPARRKKARASGSSTGSRQSSRPASPPPPLDVQVANYDEQLCKAAKRKPTRRQSGLLTTSMSITTVTSKGIATEVIPSGPLSPAFESPLRLQATLQDDDDVMEEDDGVEIQIMDEVATAPASVTRRDQRRKDKDSFAQRAVERDGSNLTEDPQPDAGRKDREKRKVKDYTEDPGSPLAGKKPKLKDVTNAFGPRPSLTNILDRDRMRTPDSDQQGASSSSSAASYSTARTFLAASVPDNYLPTPRSSSPISHPQDSDGVLLGGRERRVRKSVNYAEPKLNTKLRKPDPPPSEQKKRASTGADHDTAPRRSTSSADDGALPPSSSSSSDVLLAHGVKRKKSRPYVPEDEESDGMQADAEVGQTDLATWVNVNSRRRSHAGASTSRRLENDELRRHSVAV